MQTFLYGIFSVWLIFSMIMRKRKPFIDSRFVIELGLLFYYALAGMRFSSINYTSRYTHYYGYKYSGNYALLIYIFLFYISYLAGTKVKFTCGSYVKDDDYKYIIPNEKNRVFRFAIISCILAFLLFIAYCQMYGGIIRMLTNIAFIREGTIESDNASLQFINKLFRCAPFSIYLIGGYKDLTFSEKIWRLLATILSTIIVISYGGRGILLTLFLILIIGDQFDKIYVEGKKVNIRKIVQIFIIVIFALVIYRPLLVVIGSVHGGFDYVLQELKYTLSTSTRYNVSSFSGIISSISQSTDHYFVSLDIANKFVNNGTHHCRLILEPLSAVLNIIPSKLLGISKPDTLTFLNSFYITGVKKLAQIPAGIIAEAYYSGGVFFVVMYGFLVGYIGRRIDEYYVHMVCGVKFASTYYIAILFQYFYFGIGGDFASHFAQSLTTFIMIFIIHKMMIRVHN